MDIRLDDLGPGDHFRRAFLFRELRPYVKVGTWWRRSSG